MIKYSKLKIKSDVVEALNIFEVVFPHLKEKIGSIDSLAEKYCKNAEVILLKDNEKIIGLIVFYDNDIDSRTGYISLIGVLPSYLHAGYGYKLIDYCIAECRKNGMSSLRLEVDKDNVNAIKFYQRCGFVEESEFEKGFYFVRDI